ncbi:c-type cytochrome [Tranquillimonas alkanivorans]|uniref:Cytochrome c553 n=1 Tax=Tranquillimonas alkanivorans TaxID=441119 RepID=A0A1I5V5K6_9RHOB|nr:cytochrome c [Tranquillimonas alkanivorans]SFQ02740.1 Cytochrome c553 [Tranquillimonas alkanivorans]
MKLLSVAIGGVLLAGVGVFAWQISQPIAAPQGHSMVPPDTSAIAEGAPIVQVSVPPELSAEAQIGKRAFEAVCATCHGTNAAGRNGFAPPLVHKIYEPSHHSDRAFLNAAENGVQSHHWNFGNMPPVDGLTRADVKYIAAYVRELQRENGID